MSRWNVPQANLEKREFLGVSEYVPVRAEVFLLLLDVRTFFLMVWAEGSTIR